MKKLGFIAAFFFLLLPHSFSQGEIDDQLKLFFRNEQTFGGIISSTGYGASFRYGKRINFFNSRLFEGSINIIKHPKEIKGSNPIFPNSKRFVFGKENFFFNIQASYGFQRIKFKKKDKGGIEVRFLYAAGISLGFIKPVYYEVLVPVSLYEYKIETEKFNPSLHTPYDIYSRASFFTGFSELKVAPGLNGKFGISFEFGKADPVISVIEVGASIDLYTREIPIMASDDNRFFFPAIYASFRFGKVIDKRSQAKIDYLQNQQ
ncbi:MAG: hypothetical protein U9N53_09945 [Bacteroidota bacterium]|nr:hypothetical protein [Bacteroidota bacterium]